MICTTFVNGISPFGPAPWESRQPLPVKIRPLSTQLQQVFDWLKAHPGGRASHAAKYLGMSLPNASKSMLRLLEKGMVKRHWCLSGTDKFYVYEVIDESQN